MEGVPGGRLFLQKTHPLSSRLLLGALLCCSCLSASAQTRPTSPTSPSTPQAVGATKLPASTTSLLVVFPDAARGDSQKLLDAKVSFEVKDAAMLSVLDALLASASTHCTVEARALKPLKLTMRFHDATAGPLLDAFAKAGGARLWVFPAKLLLAPESLLTKDEKKSAQLYGVLLSKDNTTKDSALAHSAMINHKNILDVANTKVSVDFNNSKWEGTFSEITNVNGSYGLHCTPPGFGTDVEGPLATLSASFSGISIGDALAFIAHANGCELYIKPDEFVICAPSELSPDDRKVAVSAFTPSSTHFDFGSSPLLDPSAKDS